MAEKKLENRVKLVGYLKENNLEEIVNSRGNKVIRGSITVAMDEINSQRVQFYVSDTTSKGEPSKDYQDLIQLLPTNTVTIASLKKNGSDFATAANGATKVWVVARYDEYVWITEDKEESRVGLKGFRAGLKLATDKGPFIPGADFSVDIYINDLHEEDGGTGRVIVDGLLPTYDKSAYKVQFIAPVEDNIAGYVKSNYAVGDTVCLKGSIVNLAVSLPESEQGDTGFFGRGFDDRPKTKFINENRIYGGSKTPIHQGEEGSIPTQSMKDALATRRFKAEQEGQKKATRSFSSGGSKGGFSYMPSSNSHSAPKASSFPDDVDF